MKRLKKPKYWWVMRLAGCKHGDGNVTYYIPATPASGILHVMCKYCGHRFP